MTRHWRYQPAAIFAVLALFINTAASLLVHQHFPASGAAVIPYAAAFDLVVTLPVIYYFLLVRRQLQTFKSLFGLFLLCVARACWLFPSLVHAQLVPVAAELALGVLVWLRVRQAMRTAAAVNQPTDPSACVEAVCRDLIPSRRIAEFLAAELVVFYYAILSWILPVTVRDDSQSFSVHKTNGVSVLLMGVAGLTLIEMPVVHLIAARWNRSLAWVATGLALYGLIWLLGFSRSLVLKPVVLSANTLDMYKGFLWQVHVPLTRISRVRLVASMPNDVPRTLLNLALGGPPNVVVDLVSPVLAEGPWGVGKQVNAIALFLDDANSFRAAMLSTLPPQNQCAGEEGNS